MYVSGTASATACRSTRTSSTSACSLPLRSRPPWRARQQLDDLRADVVARLRVLLAGIPEADHQQIGGHSVSSRRRRTPSAAPSPPSAPSRAFARFAFAFALALGRFLFAEVEAARLHDLDDELFGFGDDRDVRREPRDRETCTWSPMSSALTS